MTRLRENHEDLCHPWLVAVWPGMGSVAVSAGYYLMAKLGMHQLAEFSARELFELDHVEVRAGLIRSARLPRSRFFVWNDPEKKRDLVVFLGEAQPPSGKNAFCQELIRYARNLGVERVFTFAAMATRMHPEHEARVFAAATEKGTLDELLAHKVEVLQEGQISGLNGVLLGAAAEAGLPGSCLLGEMPHIFAQIPFPKASLAILEVFTTIANLEVDLGDLAREAGAMNEKLGDLLARVEAAIEEHGLAGGEASPARAEQPGREPETERSGLSAEDRANLEKLFAAAEADRTKAYELKQELDRLAVFAQFEDRFLDLFKDPEEPAAG